MTGKIRQLECFVKQMGGTKKWLRFRVIGI